MVDSEDEDVLYDSHLGRTLIGEKRYKNVNDVLNGDHKDKRKLRKTLALCLAFVSQVNMCWTLFFFSSPEPKSSGSSEL